MFPVVHHGTAQVEACQYMPRWIAAYTIGTLQSGLCPVQQSCHMSLVVIMSVYAYGGRSKGQQRLAEPQEFEQCCSTLRLGRTHLLQELLLHGFHSRLSLCKSVVFIAWCNKKSIIVIQVLDFWSQVRRCWHGVRQMNSVVQWHGLRQQLNCFISSSKFERKNKLVLIK